MGGLFSKPKAPKPAPPPPDRAGDEAQKAAARSRRRNALAAEDNATRSSTQLGAGPGKVQKGKSALGS